MECICFLVMTFTEFTVTIVNGGCFVPAEIIKDDLRMRQARKLQLPCSWTSRDEQRLWLQSTVSACVSNVRYKGCRNPAVQGGRSQMLKEYRSRRVRSQRRLLLFVDKVCKSTTSAMQTPGADGCHEPIGDVKF